MGSPLFENVRVDRFCIRSIKSSECDEPAADGIPSAHPFIFAEVCKPLPGNQDAVQDIHGI
jgi:hypothetical protein